MVKNEFLPFGIADGANVLTNDEYNKLIARTNGFSSGVAKSQELNKVWRQASVIATVVAQFIAETNNQDVLDDGNVATLQKGLLSALKATVSSNVPNASLTTAGITKLSNATDSNAENIAATSKAVRQIADVVASGLDGKQDRGDYATNTALNQVNDNANSRLEKAKNGADILDKEAFINNLGLTGTVEQAENAIPKSFITQYSGNSPLHVISQDAVTRFLGEKLDKTGGQLTADDRFLLLQNQSGNTANYIEARGKDGSIRYRLGCMNSGTDVTLVNVAGKTTLAIHSSALYVNGDKVATEGAVKAGYASKVRIRRSREIETIKGRFPALYDGEVVTGVRGSYNDTFYEARNLQISIIEYLVDNEWVAAKNV